MRIEPSGVVLTGVCEVQTAACEAISPAPITAVWAMPARTQINVCRPCLDEKVRDGAWEIPGARIPQRADAAVYGPSGDLLLVVEVKSNAPGEPEAAARWAEAVHRNLILHAGIPGAPYFLLVGYPRSLFFWRQRPRTNPPREPDGSYFGPLLNGGAATGDDPADQEQAVAQWLENSIRGDRSTSSEREPDWLERLFRELRGGKVVRQTPVFT
ncbi:MAG TPA: hypothetical protein VJT67_16935 [Longimicrobiaceae bacterium]|nr:hypothetical protein [Longimicrobiaceae bacterium]